MGNNHIPGATNHDQIGCSSRRRSPPGPLGCIARPCLLCVFWPNPHEVGGQHVHVLSWQTVGIIHALNFGSI